MLSRREKASLDEFLGLLEDRAETLPPKPLSIWIAELREYCLLPDQPTHQAGLVRALGAWRVWHEATCRGSERAWPVAVQRAIECIRESALSTAVRAYGQTCQDTVTNETIRSLWSQVDRLTRSPA